MSESMSEATPLTKWLRPLLSVVTTMLVLAAWLGLANYFYNVVALLGAVLIITYILLGPVNLMENVITHLSQKLNTLTGIRHLTRLSPEANPRILAVLIVFFTFMLGLTIAIVQLFPLLSHQLKDLGVTITTQITVVSDAVVDWSDRNVAPGAATRIFEKDIQAAQKKGLVSRPFINGTPATHEEKQVIHDSVLKSTLDHIEQSFTSALPNFISLIAGTLNGFIYFLAGGLLSFYFLVDGHRFKQEILSLVPDEPRQQISELLASFHAVMFSFIKGQVMLGLLTGIYMFIIYSIFHVPYALLLGALFAIAELLPVVGTWIGITIGLCVILLNMPPIVALWVWLCSYAYQTIKDNILAPKVVGDVMGLHPLVIIISLLVCAQVAGLLGVLLALPLASVINVLIRFLLAQDVKEKIGRPGA